jgi:predicted metal-dependent peptidase
MNNTKDLISKAKYQLYKGFPFFSYLIEHLDIKEDKRVPTMGVDGKGTVYYDKAWVDSICPNNSTKVLMGVLAHEALHLVFEHPKRMKGRNVMIGDVSLWNIAGDIYINNVILSNYASHVIKDMQMELPKEGILPVNNEIEWMGIKIVDINLKTTEEIYDELKVGVKDLLEKNKGKKEKGQGIPVSGFDSHVDWDKEGQDGAGQEKTKQINKSGKDWKKIMAEAKALSQNRGDTPLGMDREINDVHKSRINWKHFVQKVVSNYIPQDYTWNKPNKKYIGEEIYLPSTYGESIRVLFGIDTSGSQSQEDLTDSMSEVVAITRQYSNIEFRAITFDTEVHENLNVYNGNVKKLKQLRMRGGGGSSSICLYNLIEEKKYNRNTKLLIFFTDGYMEFPKKFTIPTILVLTENHCAIKDLPKQALAVIEMKPK